MTYRTKDGKTIHVGLVLQGGGALGAYEVGVVRRLKELDLLPDVVSGVSIGAINAAVVAAPASGDPLQSLYDIWDALTTPNIPFAGHVTNEFVSMFGNPGMYAPRTDIFMMPFWTSFYSTAPLIGTLERFVDFDRLNPAGGGRHLILTATDVETGALAEFDSHRIQITPHHVAASGSLPPGFPATTIDGPGGTARSYWDGGLFSNTPLAPVVDAMRKVPADHKRLFVADLFPKHSSLPRNMLEVSNRMSELLFANKFDGDIRRTRDLTHLQALRDALDRDLPPDSPVRQMPGFKLLGEAGLAGRPDIEPVRIEVDEIQREGRHGDDTRHHRVSRARRDLRLWHVFERSGGRQARPAPPRLTAGGGASRSRPQLLWVTPRGGCAAPWRPRPRPRPEARRRGRCRGRSAPSPAGRGRSAGQAAPRSGPRPASSPSRRGRAS